MKNVVVVGGGIIGLCSAYYLQKSGHNVTVIDKSDFTDNCSYGNAGYVCPSHFTPLAAPGIVWQGLKWMFNSKSPFYVKPTLNPALFDWGTKFIKKSTQKNVDDAAIPLRDIAVFSKQEYFLWSKQPGFDFAFTQNGLLEIVQTEKLAEHARHTVEKAKSLALDVEWLDYDELQQLEPSTKINGLGAIFFKCDAHLYPDKLMLTLLRHLEQNNVLLVRNEEVTGFQKEANKIKSVITDKGSYPVDELVIATGAWSRELCAQLEIKLPLIPGRGYSITLENSPYHLHRPVILAEARVAVTPMDGNKIRFGGTMEVVSTDTPPKFERVAGILRSVKRYLPEFDIAMPATDKLWYGYRPCSADGLPYIGRVNKYKNIIVATGHSMLGLSLGAGTGKLVGELVDEKESSINISQFAVERFK